MTVIIYRPGDDPRVILAEVIQRDPGQSYMLMPASLARCLGLTEKVISQLIGFNPTAVLDHEPERMPWGTPAKEREVI